MDNETLGVSIFVVICIVLSLTAHWKLKSFWVASFSAAVLAVITFQTIAYVQLGYMDPFLPIAMVVSGVIAIFISCIIGGIFKYIVSKLAGG